MPMDLPMPFMVYFMPDEATLILSALYEAREREELPDKKMELHKLQMHVCNQLELQRKKDNPPT